MDSEVIRETSTQPPFRNKKPPFTTSKGSPPLFPFPFFLPFLSSHPFMSTPIRCGHRQLRSFHGADGVFLLPTEKPVWGLTAVSLPFSFSSLPCGPTYKGEKTNNEGRPSFSPHSESPFFFSPPPPVILDFSESRR